MTDNLRDRVAAVLSAALAVQQREISEFQVWQSFDMHRLTDALLTELGLRPEWGLLDDTDSGRLYDSRAEACAAKALPRETLRIRMITDWVDVPQG